MNEQIKKKITDAMLAMDLSALTLAELSAYAVLARGLDEEPHSLCAGAASALACAFLGISTHRIGDLTRGGDTYAV